MPPLSIHHRTLLTASLKADFVPYLPLLLNPNPDDSKNDEKNLSRAFSAFALKCLCEVSTIDSAAAVVDDFDDFGVDAIYYHASTETLYLVQAKLKASETFTQAEANAFCQGVRKLIKLEFSGFNQNVLRRQSEIEGALDICSHIQLVVAHTGSGLSSHAKVAINDLLSDEDHGEDRFVSSVIDYDGSNVEADLQAAKRYSRVDSNLTLYDWACSSEPLKTYFGLMKVSDLIALHEKHGKALYAKNIRVFLGQTTEVNKAIRDTLAKKPADFFYLNNGVTALCERIEPKSGSRSEKKFKITGLSIINGAQTIASSARFSSEPNATDISTARVLVTLIKTDGNDGFGKDVTKARNHQNPVLLANFAALDDGQERLRQQLAYLDIYYAYKAEGPENSQDPKRIRIDEAAQALSLLQPDPRYPVWLKKEPSQLLDTNSYAYTNLFHPGLSGIELANAVRVLRYIQFRMVVEAAVASGAERLTYKHGNHALGFVLMKRLGKSIRGAGLIDEQKLKINVGPAFDIVREALWTLVQRKLRTKGPLSIFRSQTELVPLLGDLMIEHYQLGQDSAIASLKAKVIAGEAYPTALFDYLAQKAPQIGSLT